MRIFLSFAALLTAAAAPLSAEEPSRETLRTTYHLSFKCYVANQVASGDRRYNADGSQTDSFATGRQNSYRAIWHFGRAIGKTDTLIQEDLESFDRMYRERFRRDDAFFQRARYECQQIGLM